MPDRQKGPAVVSFGIDRAATGDPNLGLARSRSAFTLLELLITIFIIGILAALLLPTLGRSKASARDTTCLNNLHQIGIAVQVYVDENENRLPIMFDSPIAGEVGITNALLPSAGTVLLPYLTTSNMLRCPSDNRNLFVQTGSSYAWNTVLNGQDADHLTWLGSSFEAHQIPVFFDKDAFHKEKGEGRAVNYLYADGHIKNLLTIDTRK